MAIDIDPQDSALLTAASAEDAHDENIDDARSASPRAARRALEIAPEMLSQLTVLAVCGISPRVYLELLRTDGFSVRVIRLGKLRLVRREEFVSWLESLAPTKAAKNKEEPPEPPDDDDPDAIDDLIRGLGYRRKVAPPQRQKAPARGG